MTELVAHNEAKGLVGDAVYEAIIDTATHGHNAPGTLSDIETTAVYSRIRAADARLTTSNLSVTASASNNGLGRCRSCETRFAPGRAIS